MPFTISIADEYQLGEQKIELPFPKEMLAKTTKPKENLVFFDSSWPPPRPIITVTLSLFRFPAEDLSAFKARYRREKEQWLKKEKSEMMGVLELNALPETQAFVSRLSFLSPLGTFHEWARFEQCGENEAVAVKMMIPEDFRQKEGETLAKWAELIDRQLCSTGRQI